MKSIFYIILFSTINMFAQGFQFSTTESLNEMDPLTFDEKGYTEYLPAYYSLEKYVPPVMTQEGGTCVGFSSLYYGLSLSYNIEHGYQRNVEKYANSFDPYFIYSILNNEKYNCEDGLNMNEAMNTLSKIGSKKMFFPQFLSCNSKWDKEQFLRTVNYTEPYKIKNYYYINPNRINFIEDVKRAISYDIPVIVGAYITKSLGGFSPSNLYGVSSNGLWNPLDNEPIEGGHAMCVIGYDDNKFGGSFRIVNSWGTDYGDNGFLWIRYSDFKKYIVEAYIIEPSEFENNSNFKRIVFEQPKYYGHVYEGQIKNGYFHGYGIYSFNDGTYLIGNYNMGSRENWFIYIDENNEELIKMMYFQNDKLIDTQTLGFSENNGDEYIQEIDNYLQLISPQKKIIFINEEPDITLPKKIN